MIERQSTSTQTSTSTQASIPTSTSTPITFREYVRALPHQWVLDNLISSAADKSRRIVSSAMVEEAVVKFAAKASLVRRFKALPPALRLRCAQVYLMGGSGLLSAEPPFGYGGDPLIASLLVFATQGGGVGGSGVRFFGFDEFEPALRGLMAEELLGMGEAGDSLPMASASVPWRPLNDVAAVCSLASQGMLPRSVHGGLARSALNALKRLVHDPTLSGRSLEDGEPGHPAGFLMGYCVGESLIAADGAGGYALNRGKLAAWLSMGASERLGGMAGYAGEFLGGMGLEVARELLSRSNGHFLAVNQILPEAERAAFTRALDVFEFLGYAQTCRSHSAVRFSACGRGGGDADAMLCGESARGTVIMPDFSVVIPQEVSPDELFGFSKIGMLDAFDKVYRGYITKESVSNALSAGASAEHMRDWLRDRRAAANVVKTVDEWIREFGRLYVSAMMPLVSCDESVTRQIAAIEPLRKHITRVSAHAVFAIKRGSEGKVVEILEKLGFDTRPPGEQAEGAQHDAKPALPPQKNAKRRITPLTDFSNVPSSDPKAIEMRRTKYGSGLKELGISEMIQVVDYAMLTNQSLVIDYDGSAYIKQSVYTVVPLGIDKGVDAAVEAEIPCMRGRKQFFLSKIKRIGVVAQ